MPASSFVLRRPALPRVESLRRVARAPLVAPLFAASIAVGLRDSLSLPYTTLFAIERAHMGPLAVGVYLTLRAAGAIAVSLWFGAWFDRRPSLWPLLVSLVAGTLGYALTTTTTNVFALCLIGAVPLGMGAAAFPLVFAIAKGWSAKTDFLTATRSLALLRISFSLAWGVGPAIGAYVVGDNDYDALFWVSAGFSALACAPFLRGWAPAPVAAKPPAEAPRLSGAVALAAASLTLFSMAIGMGMVALPVAITADFAGSKHQVGLAVCLCALLEAPVMLAIAARPHAFMGYRGMFAGFVAAALYFLAAGLAGSAETLIYAQVLRAVSIGLVSCIGIGYLQDMLPNRVGAASALYGNTGQAGSLMAGLAAGAWAQAYSYGSLFWPCAVASVAGLACLAAGRLCSRSTRIAAPCP
jgi:SET family sugar efflux transporter-like MFS transporter